eukprot:3218077-Amphidinium_carterae.1
MRDRMHFLLPHEVLPSCSKLTPTWARRQRGLTATPPRASGGSCVSWGSQMMRVWSQSVCGLTRPLCLGQEAKCGVNYTLLSWSNHSSQVTSSRCKRRARGWSTGSSPRSSGPGRLASPVAKHQHAGVELQQRHVLEVGVQHCKHQLGHALQGKHSWLSISSCMHFTARTLR